MKNLFLVASFFLFFGDFIFAQTDTLKIEKSNDKVMIGGQVYYVHIVKQGETLYSLSIAYGVSQKEIAKENPEIFLGLLIGQALKIPLVKKETGLEKIDETNEFIFHRVKKGQTLYSLSRKYNISQEDIINNNPAVKYGINVDQVIKIPKKGFTSNEVTIPKTNLLNDTLKISSEYIYHDVKSKETLYSLIRLYNISEELLYDLNPFLSDGLKVGQKLRIPKVRDAEEGFVFENMTAQSKDTVVYENRNKIAYSDSVVFLNCDTLKKEQRRPYNVALLLPFYKEQCNQEFYIDSTKRNEFGKRIYETIYRSPNYIYPRALNYIQFYEGLLMAVDSIKRQGVSINLHVFDTEGDTNKVNDILLLPKMKNMDLIIGPVYTNEVEIVSRFSLNHRIKMVSPLSDNMTIVENNPYMFQVSPGFVSQFDELAKASTEFKNNNVILLHNINPNQYNIIASLKDKLFNYYSLDTSLRDLQFKEVYFNDSTNVIEHALSKTSENIIIVPSNDQAFVSLIMSNLNTLVSRGYKIRTFGMSRWYRFGNIDPEYFFTLNTHLVVPFYIDYKEKKVIDFISKYKSLFKAEPDQYVMHGFDVSMYFFTALMNYGTNFHNCIYHHQISQLQGDFRFVKWNEYSGYENVGMSILRYKSDYNILQVSCFQNTNY